MSKKEEKQTARKVLVAFLPREKYPMGPFFSPPYLEQLQEVFYGGESPICTMDSVCDLTPFIPADIHVDCGEAATTSDGYVWLWSVHLDGRKIRRVFLFPKADDGSADRHIALHASADFCLDDSVAKHLAELLLTAHRAWAHRENPKNQVI